MLDKPLTQLVQLESDRTLSLRLGSERTSAEIMAKRFPCDEKHKESRFLLVQRRNSADMCLGIS